MSGLTASVWHIIIRPKNDLELGSRGATLGIPNDSDYKEASELVNSKAIKELNPDIKPKLHIWARKEQSMLFSTLILANFRNEGLMSEFVPDLKVMRGSKGMDESVKTVMKVWNQNGFSDKVKSISKDKNSGIQDLADEALKEK